MLALFVACSAVCLTGVRVSADEVQPFAVELPDKFTYKYWIRPLDSDQSVAINEAYKAPDNGDYWITWQVELKEPIAKGDTIDVLGYLSLTQGNPWQEWRVCFIDEAWTTHIYWNSTNTNHQSHLSRVQKSYSSGTRSYWYSYNITDVTAPASIKYIWIMQKVTAYKGQWMDAGFSDFSVNVQSDSGKISSILEYIKNLPTNIKNALQSLFDGITNAISNAVSSILEGIKNLFVPSESDITAYKDKWDQLLQERFGALYQCVTLVQSYWQSLNPTQSKSSIEFPMVTIDVGNGVYWEFGGYDVTLIPSGFEYLFQVLRMIVNAICTMAVFNVLKDKYERLVDG